MVEAVRAVFNPRDLRADRQYSITRGLDGLFREFRYDIDADNLLRVVFRRQPGDVAAAFDVEVVPVPKEYKLDAVGVALSAEHTSLIEAFDAEGENIQLALRLAEVFGGRWTSTPTFSAATAEVLFDRAMRDGEFSATATSRPPSMWNVGRTLTAIRYTGADGREAWVLRRRTVDPCKRQFLKSPLGFRSARDLRVFLSTASIPCTAGIAPSRCGLWAPLGTAVYAVASGVVESAEWSGEAGRMVRIRHAGGYETAYLHLSAFGRAFGRASRVDQGQLIGRVGRQRHGDRHAPATTNVDQERRVRQPGR